MVPIAAPKAKTGDRDREICDIHLYLVQ